MGLGAMLHQDITKLVQCGNLDFKTSGCVSKYSIAFNLSVVVFDVILECKFFYPYMKFSWSN